METPKQQCRAHARVNMFLGDTAAPFPKIFVMKPLSIAGVVAFSLFLTAAPLALASQTPNDPPPETRDNRSCQSCFHSYA